MNLLRNQLGREYAMPPSIERLRRLKRVYGTSTAVAKTAHVGRAQMVCPPRLQYGGHAYASKYRPLNHGQKLATPHTHFRRTLTGRKAHHLRLVNEHGVRKMSP